MTPSFNKIDITAELVSRLVAKQFPALAGMPIVPVEQDGWDNSTFRLGPDMSVRLPTADVYAMQVDKERRWLPILARFLPRLIPEPIAKGAPSADFPRPWSIYRWREGEPSTVEGVRDLRSFAAELSEFLAALQQIDPSGGPPPGEHNFFRGAALYVYDADARASIAALDDEIDGRAATAVWEAGLDTTWRGAPVWLHGDVAPTNLLVVDGHLNAVIDFGCCGVGDPACDLMIAWTFLTEESRNAFRSGLPLDEPTWARGRAWTLWKALITLADARRAGPAAASVAGLRSGWRVSARQVISDVIAEHGRCHRD
ncbi:MAG: aminoglycoside phosphotransferase family protein [Acidimicrobiales bacterium]